MSLADMDALMDELLNILDKIIDPYNIVENVDDIPKAELSRFYDQIKCVYEKDFRHSYSLLSTYLEGKSPDVYPLLRTWLRQLYEYGKNTLGEKDVSGKIMKLLDHVELETIRLDRMKAVQMYSEDMKRLQTEMGEVAKESTEMASAVKQDVEKYHEQSVAILSIFSAVVLAFMGGISFSSGILGAISQTTVFRLVLTILMLGFVLFNSIFVLLRYVAYIIQKQESLRFKTGIRAFNIALVVALALLIIVYACGGGSKIEEWGRIELASSTSSTSTE